MALDIEYATNVDTDLLLVIESNCDRVGIAVKDKDGEFVLLSGNETGVLLLDYICSQRVNHGRMPKDPTVNKDYSHS